MTTAIHEISTHSLAESRAYCHDLTRRAAKNFYYGLKLLPEPKRSSMYALYAYMRLVDDIADEPDGRTLVQRENDLAAFRQVTHAILDGDVRAGEGSRQARMWPAFAELVRNYRIPNTIFDDMIDGQLQDLQPVEIKTFKDLHAYCYRVASVVGLASIYVWGFTGGDATCQMAIDRGIAFQLTNVLRDLKEDAGRDRVYVPADELKSAGIELAALRFGAVRESFVGLMQRQISRAEEYYEKSAMLEERIAADSRPTLQAMTRIYHGLLRKIARKPEVVLQKRVSLSPITKFSIALQALRAR